jgi:hypothetical protein
MRTIDLRPSKIHNLTCDLGYLDPYLKLPRTGLKEIVPELLLLHNTLPIAYQLLPGGDVSPSRMFVLEIGEGILGCFPPGKSVEKPSVTATKLAYLRILVMYQDRHCSLENPLDAFANNKK